MDVKTNVRLRRMRTSTTTKMSVDSFSSVRCSLSVLCVLLLTLATAVSGQFTSGLRVSDGRYSRVTVRIEDQPPPKDQFGCDLFLNKLEVGPDDVFYLLLSSDMFVVAPMEIWVPIMSFWCHEVKHLLMLIAQTVFLPRSRA